MMLDESLERAGPDGLLLHAIRKNGKDLLTCARVIRRSTGLQVTGDPPNGLPPHRGWEVVSECWVAMYNESIRPPSCVIQAEEESSVSIRKRSYE
uniref:DUF4116 domain-containing protein n=1 Tax=Angiostrongylus cantonensis TaxID=6313 RepID=A0A0K0CW02_ANGCA